MLWSTKALAACPAVQGNPGGAVQVLLQESLRPILVQLGYHSKLQLPLLSGLARLLQLLSSWFNITLGAPVCVSIVARIF